MPTVFIVLATFGGLFVLVAAILRLRIGTRAIWPFWAIYLTAVSISCIYKLSGLKFGVSTSAVGHTVYLGVVAIVALGLPLAASSVVLIRKHELDYRSNVISTVMSWAVCIALTPVAVAMVAIVDFLNLMLIAG